MSKPVALLITGDFHTNSKVSLCPADGAALDDGDFYIPNAAQKDLYQFWIDQFLPWVKACSRGHRLIFDHGGDGIDGAGHHGSLQTFGTDDDAENLHVEMLEPLINMVDEIIYMRG